MKERSCKVTKPTAKWGGRLVALIALACAFGAARGDEWYSSNTTLSGDEPIETPVQFNVDAGVTVTVTRVISGTGKVEKNGGKIIKIK